MQNGYTKRHMDAKHIQKEGKKKESRDMGWPKTNKKQTSWLESAGANYTD
jgi:hypothetical protein